MIQQMMIPESAAASFGLKPAQLHGLEQVIILAGPNGAGKSRYLRLIAKMVKSVEQLYALKQKALKLGKNINIDASLITPEQLQNTFAQARPLWELAGKKQNEIEDTMKSTIEQIQFMQGLVCTHNCRVSVLDYQGFSPLHIINQGEIPINRLNEYLTISEGANFTEMYKNIHIYLSYIAQILYSAEHPKAKLHIQDEQLDSVTSFNEILFALLQGKISYDIGDNFRVIPKLFDREFNPLELSAGQLILIAWAISLHRQSGTLRDSIVLIDEPETHLHAEMCIEALERLRNQVLGPHGQMWIATHCPAVLAHYGVQSLYHVKNGAIYYAGAGHVEEVMDSILGGEGGRQKLSTALLDAEHVAFTSFAAQCILPAGIANHQSGDKQEQQFNSAVAQLVAKPGSMVRILDFSAGKGRLAAALFERRSCGSADGLERVQYHAYNDPKFTPSDVSEQCRHQLSLFNDNKKPYQNYWESLAELKSQHSSDFDLVILSNVLHEVDVRDWRRLFLDIAELLSKKGQLLIIEDLLPPVGELPNMWGYIILDRCGFEKLFGSPEAVRVIDNQNNRLLAIAISRQHVQAVDISQIKAALAYLKDKAHEEILKLRTEPTEQRNHQTGRKHAHYTMLYTNTSLAIDRL